MRPHKRSVLTLHLEGSANSTPYARQVEAVVALNIERGVEARRSLLRRLLPPALRDSEDTVPSAPPKARLATCWTWALQASGGPVRCTALAPARPAGQQLPLQCDWYPVATRCNAADSSSTKDSQALYSTPLEAPLLVLGADVAQNVIVQGR